MEQLKIKLLNSEMSLSDIMRTMSLVDTLIAVSKKKQGYREDRRLVEYIIYQDNRHGIAAT